MSFFGSEYNQKTILGHPVGLFILFFTEMWERFSYYGMRAIFVLFLVSKIEDGGFGWERSDALVWYAWYTGLVYATPLIGGWIADRYFGYRNAVIYGALLMTLGHVALAFEMFPTFVLGIGLLIAGNGLFKPNMTPIVGQMYPEGSPLKDGAYTIFYMGVNAGAFLGIAICGYMGENVGWNLGFGLAGVFMFFGLLQFKFGQGVFGDLGGKPDKLSPKEIAEKFGETEVPFTNGDRNMLIGSIILLVSTVVALNVIELENPFYMIPIALPFIVWTVIFLLRRMNKYPTIERDRLKVIGILAFFVIFFWLAFEQAGGTMTIFARDYTDRSLSTGSGQLTFQVLSLVLTFIPMAILTWVLVMLGKHLVKPFPLTILFTSISFVIIWGIIIWINYNNFYNENLEVPASWFGTLNSFFIISLAPFFSWMWVKLSGSPINPSGPIKFALGLFLLGMGFVALVIGASEIPQGAKTASVSMIWLVIAYFFHTVGELFLSPVGLSFVNKLSPMRLMALMFGVWYLANFVANTAGGIIGSYIDKITEVTSMSSFFMIFVISSFAAALALVLLNKPLKKLMHGVN
ncbi:MAG: MFS transporter [Bacteroidetes bacterium]|nr:MAG: MFS transporter [Bacteroidota bacterium]